MNTKKNHPHFEIQRMASKNEATTDEFDATLNELMQAGLTAEEAAEAILQSIDSNDNDNTEVTEPKLKENEWTCKICTYINHITRNTCEMCDAVNCEIKVNRSDTTVSRYTCPQMQRLIKDLSKYQNNLANNKFAKDDTMMLQVLDDFLYLSNKNNDKRFFHLIAQTLPACDISKCICLKRNFRHRTQLNYTKQKLITLYNDESKRDDIDMKYMVYSQLMDKIHCYYFHSYDTGMRLRATEEQVLKSFLNDEDDEDSKWSESFICKQLLKIKQLLKTNTDQNIDQFSLISNKFDQLKMTEQLQLKSKEYKSYNFGTAFYYGYKDEQHLQEYYIELKDEKEIQVTAKYPSLKEELIDNKVAVLGSEQFNNEYEKCTIHFRSSYKRMNVPNISIENLLSLMIYCNYDFLQNQFTKTYWQNIENHCSFYHLGKNLKIAVHQHGFKNGKYLREIEYFYHGIGQQLLFPVFLPYRTAKINICCPLSTSTSFCVAANFTNHSKGLIVEFSANEFINYFSVSWISDFPGEKEKLFIQNIKGSVNKLEIYNIYDAKTNVQFDVILRAMEIIQKCVSFSVGIGSEDNWCNYDVKKVKSPLPIEDGFIPHSMRKKYDNVSQNMCELIARLVDDQLPRSSQQYESLSSLHPYARDIVATQCEFVEEIDIIYDKHPEKQIFFDSDWIKLDVINIVFSNAYTVSVYDINLREFVMENIRRFFVENVNKTNISNICIYPSKTTENSIQTMVEKYTDYFRSISAYIYDCQYGLEILLCDEIEFICTNVEYMGGIYFVDSNNSISKRMRNLIAAELTSIQSTDDEQKEFHECCEHLMTIDINWNNIRLLFPMLCHSQFEWIKLDMLLKLFPQIEDIHIKNINVDCNILDDILNCWNNGPSLRRINLMSNDLSNSIKNEVLGYQKHFENIALKLSLTSDEYYSCNISIGKC
eukprot:460132_1